MATIGDNVAVIDHDDDFIRAGRANPERDPSIITPTLVRHTGRGGGGDVGDIGASP
jgi:hypothetical protein